LICFGRKGTVYRQVHQVNNKVGINTMKTKILMAFLTSVLIGGTFGSTFVQAAVPSDFDNEVACEGAGFSWSGNLGGNRIRCRFTDNAIPRDYTNEADCSAAGYFWSPNRQGINLKCRLNNFTVSNS
jgi:hypothetical protein